MAGPVHVSAGQLGITYQGVETALKMRIYNRHNYIPVGGPEIIGSRVGSEIFFGEVDVTVDPFGVPTFAGFDIYPTENAASDPRETYISLALYTTDGKPRGVIYKKLYIPEAPSNTTLELLAIFSDAQTPAKSTTFKTLSAGAIMNMFASLINMATKATEAIYGAVKLSVPAVASGFPIAVGDNDPRITTHLNGLSTLAAAIAAAGASQVPIPILSPITISADTTVPANTPLDIDKAGLITVAAGKTLTIGALQSDPGPRKIFVLANSTTSHVRFGSGAVVTHRPEWFTGPTEGQNATIALRELFASINAVQGGSIALPDGSWLVDPDVLTVPSSFTMDGTGGFSTGGTHGTVLKASGSGSFIFQVAEATEHVALGNGFTIDCDNDADYGVYMHGSSPNTAFNIQLRANVCNAKKNGIKQHADDGEWQVEQLIIGPNLMVDNHEEAIFCHTANGSLFIDRANILVPGTKDAIRINGFGVVNINGVQFAGQAGSPACVLGAPSTARANRCILIEGGMVALNIYGGCQDEGFQSFLEHQPFDDGLTINIEGNLIQSRLLLKGSATIVLEGNKMGASKLVQDQAGASYRIYDRNNKPGANDQCGVPVVPPTNDGLVDPASGGGSSFIEEDYPRQNFKRWRQRNIFFQNDLYAGLPDGDPWIMFMSTRGDKKVVFIGACDNYGLPTFGYFFYRKSSDGHLKIEGNQPGVKAIDMDCPLFASGAVTTDGIVNAGQTMIRGKTTPAQITVDQNDYDPGGIGYRQRWSTSASKNITGFAPTGGQTDGAEYLIINVGANPIVLQHQNVGSAAAHRFLNTTGADITLSANQQADVVYDTTIGRWLVSKRN